MNPTARSHAWAQSRFAAFATGLVPADEESELREHLRACATCRTELDAFLVEAESEVDAEAEAESGRDPGTGPAAEEHIPAGLLWRFERNRRSLRPLEQELVEHHLERCELCRTANDFARGLAGRPHGRAGRRRRLPAAGITVAAAAAAAAVIATILLQSERGEPPRGPAPEGGSSRSGPVPSPTPRAGGPTTPAPAPPGSAPRADLLAGPYALEAPARSGEGDTNRFVVPRGATGVTVLPPPLEGWPREARLRVEVRGPSGELLLAQELENGDLFPDAGPRPLVLRPKSGTLGAGQYQLRLTTLEAAALTGEPETAEYTFELALR